MEFLSVKEFTASPRKTRAMLQRDRRLVLTSRGKPSMLVFDIIGQDLETVVDTLNRVEAIQLLDTIQRQAARAHLDTMTLDEINDEIAAYRKGKNAP